MRLILISLLIACGGSKPASQAPSNTGSATAEVKPAAGGDKCAEQKTCTACIAMSTEATTDSCHWDIDKQTCAVACDPSAKNCLVVGGKNLGEDRAMEVCAGVKQ